MNKDAKISNTDLKAAEKRERITIERRKEKYMSLKDDLVKLEEIKRHHETFDKSKKSRKNIQKEIKCDVKLTLPAGNALPKPPVSTVIGPSGISITKFCDDFNEWSKNYEGNIEIGVIIYDDFSYNILTKEQYTEYKQGQLDQIISSSKLYKEFKEDEDKRFHR